MAKFSASILIIFPLIALVLGGVFAVPASAAQLEGPKESCEVNLSRIDAGKFSWEKNVTPSNSTVPSPGKFTVGPEGEGLQVSKNEWGSKDWAIICLIDTIGTITNWIFFALMAVSALFIIAAAFVWVTSGAKAENQKKAGQMILAALVGIAIALLSRIIPGLVTGLLA